MPLDSTPMRGFALMCTPPGGVGAVQGSGRVHAHIDVGCAGADLDVVAVLAAVHLADVQVGALLGHRLGDHADDHTVDLGTQVDQFLHLKAAGKQALFQLLGGRYQYPHILSAS